MISLDQFLKDFEQNPIYVSNNLKQYDISKIELSSCNDFIRMLLSKRNGLYLDLLAGIKIAENILSFFSNNDAEDIMYLNLFQMINSLGFLKIKEEEKINIIKLVDFSCKKIGAYKLNKKIFEFSLLEKILNDKYVFLFDTFKNNGLNFDKVNDMNILKYVFLDNSENGNVLDKLLSMGCETFDGSWEFVFNKANSDIIKYGNKLNLLKLNNEKFITNKYYNINAWDSLSKTDNYFLLKYIPMSFFNLNDEEKTKNNENFLKYSKKIWLWLLKNKIDKLVHKQDFFKFLDNLLFEKNNDSYLFFSLNLFELIIPIVDIIKNKEENIINKELFNKLLKENNVINYQENIEAQQSMPFTDKLMFYIGNALLYKNIEKNHKNIELMLDTKYDDEDKIIDCFFNYILNPKIIESEINDIGDNNFWMSLKKTLILYKNVYGENNFENHFFNCFPTNIQNFLKPGAFELWRNEWVLQLDDENKEILADFVIDCFNKLNDTSINIEKEVSNNKEIIENEIIEVDLYTEENFKKFQKDMDNATNENAKIFLKKNKNVSSKKQLAKATTMLNKIDDLYEGFPHFKQAIDYIRKYMILQEKGDKTFSIPPLLLGGGPGVGKTFFCHTISQLVHTPFEVFNMESMTANFVLTGSSAVWAGGEPGAIFRILTNPEQKMLNPIFLLDEVDKCGGDRRYGVMNSLLPLLEKYTAKNFKDECIPLQIDASYINWFATANDIDKLTPPIKSRFEIISIPNPNLSERKALIKGIYKSIKKNNSWGHIFNENISNETLDVLAKLMAPGAARDLRKSITNACAKAIEEGKTELLPHHIEKSSNIIIMPWDMQIEN